VCSRFPPVEPLLKDLEPLNLDGHPSVIIVGKSGLNTGRDVRGMDLRVQDHCEAAGVTFGFTP
jgi:protein gp37